MFRRILSVGCLIAAALSPACAFAAQKVIVGDTGAPSSIIGRTLAVFKEKAEQYSKGDLQVQVFSNSQLGTFGTMATQMKVNLVNVMFIQPDALGEQVSIVTANAWPFLFKDQDEMMAAWNGPGGKALIAEVEKRSGYRMIAPSWNVPRWVYTTRDAKGLDDLKGMKIRVPGTAIYVQQIKLLGLSPTPMNIAETFTAMQQRVVEGIEGAISDMAGYSIQDVAKSVVKTGHVLSPKAFLTFGKWVDTLTPANKEAFYKAAEEASKFYGDTTKAEEQDLIDKFKAKGIHFVEPGYTVDQMRTMVEPMKTLLPEVWTWAQKLAGKE
ncbi:TRAP transporter substrate-binding protein [Aquabacter sp. CN5-332]|uniref:TRAP transporter substrate-binding protein n=1 Tax=Aquabacter sp. CN5-332 TaxID=3156608 RepID=UPI0032B61430